MEHKLRRIQIRRGLSSQRTEVLYEEGEPLYLIDKQRVYIGDNKTFGGILVGNVNVIEKNKEIPFKSVPTDLIYVEDNKTTYIYDKIDGLLPITSSVDCCKDIQKEIDDMNKYLDFVYDKYCKP